MDFRGGKISPGHVLSLGVISEYDLKYKKSNSDLSAKRGFAIQKMFVSLHAQRITRV